MPNYQDAKIYKIVNDDLPNLAYYGSTCGKLSARFTVHKNHKNESISSKNLFQTENARIELVEDYPCETKEQLLLQERKYIQENDCVNIRSPITTADELKVRYEKNREKKLEYLKQYYQKNKKNKNKNDN